MADMHIDNIKKINEMLKDDLLNKLVLRFNASEKSVKEFKGVLTAKYEELSSIKETETFAEEPVAEVVEEERTEEVLREKPEAPEVKEEVSENKDEQIEDSPETPSVNPEEKAEEPAPKPEQKSEQKPEETPEEEQAKKPKPVEKPAETIKNDKKSDTAKPMPSFIVRREFVPKNNTDTRAQNFKTSQSKPYVKGEKPAFTPRPSAKKPQNTYVAPPIVPTSSDKRSFGKKNKGVEKNFEEKHVINKRALIKNNVDIDDFDENKTGYRKFRPVKKAKEEQPVNTIKIDHAVVNTEIIPLKVLSEKIGITTVEITKRLFKEGIMKTINDSVDFDTAAFIADDLGVELELKLDKTAEDVLSAGFEDVLDEEKDLVRRPPVVTVMGHVDHGKTSILDKIRKTNVTAGEAGGITQHIGAYTVTVNGSPITFLDTPGHAAFTAMRARGAQATDIAVLVVAADDGIMPQTIEAISHAKAADVPIIVAVNKIDKPEANIERIKQQLTDHGLLPEEWGGDVIVCPVSAKTGEGINGLLESINLLAEIKDLKANPDRKAKGVVIEAKLDNSKGPIATVLIQNGTLKVSDNVIVGTVTGKIRAMTDDKGRRVNSAGPSVPVSIMGLDEVPNAGDILYAVEQDKLMKLVAEERKNKERENMIKSASKVTLDDVFDRIAEGEIKGLNIIVKADVQGSVEAVKQSLEKLSNDEVRINVIHAQAGAIKESDIMLAESSNAIIIGFNVRPDSNAKQIAEKSKVDIKLYRVIYEAIEDVEKALKGMLKPKFSEVYLGKAEVREVFKISGVGQVAGSYVTDGKILRSGKLRIYRDDVMICEGNVLQLKRFKDDVKEVAQGYECGISIEKFNDIKIGDYIECYQVEEEKN